MNIHGTIPAARTPLSSLKRSVAIISLVALSAVASAQWPTDYTQPAIVASGSNVRAGDVRVSQNDTVIFAADSTSVGTHAITAVEFSKPGDKTILTGDLTNGLDLVANKIQLLQEEFPTDKANMAVQFSPSDVNDEVYPAIGTWFGVLDNGNVLGQTIDNLHRFLGAGFSDGLTRFLTFDPVGHELMVKDSDGNSGAEVSLPYNTIKNFTMHTNSSGDADFAYTRYFPGDISATRVIIGQIYEGGNTLSTVFSSLESGSISQSRPQWTSLSGTANDMLTWIGEQYGTTALYSQVYDNNLAPIVSQKLLLDNVVSYAVTPSTLGIPVMGAVTRDNTVYPPADTLVAGLLDPVNGVALVLPFASGFQMDFKTIRQEENGDFSLIYSVYENGRNVLKVRRVSGTTAGTLWETTVADLGQCSPEHLEMFPNTFVDGDTAGALYILARYDLPFSNYSEMQAVRVRQDGQLGADPVQAPINPYIGTSSENHVQLLWGASPSPGTNYLIGRTETDFSGIQILGSVSTESTAFVDTIAELGKTYHYYVAAFNGASGDYAIAGPVTTTVTPGVPSLGK